jgi:hypothetical protein
MKGRNSSSLPARLPPPSYAFSYADAGSLVSVRNGERGTVPYLPVLHLLRSHLRGCLERGWGRILVGEMPAAG